MTDFNVFYHDLEKNEKSTALAYLLLRLLKSSETADGESTALDQEVNVYLAHLLLSMANPRHLEQTNKFISTNDSEVASMVTESTDASLKYLIYKSNADHLLTLTSLFREAKPNKEWVGGVSMDALVGRGKTYYGFAAAYIRQIHRKVTAVMEVMEKLSGEFERYSLILQNLSSSYFNFASGMAREEMKEFMEQVSRIEDEIKLKELQDQFLDTYSLWLKSRDEELLKQIEALAQKIQKQDPTFKFTPPQHS